MNKDTSKGIGNNPIKLVDNGDGTYSVAASITGSLANIPVEVKSSTIAVPVDVQFSSLDDANPIQTKAVASNVRNSRPISSIARFQSQSIAAGASLTLLSSSSSLANYDWVAVGVIPASTHSYEVYADVYGTASPFSYYEYLIAAASQSRKLSARTQLRGLSTVIKLKNNDMATQTYTDVEVFGG